MSLISEARTTVGSLAQDEFERRLLGSGLSIQFGPFLGRIQLTVEGIFEPLYRLYEHFPVAKGRDVHSFHIAMQGVRSPFRPFRRQVRLTVDGRAPHEDMPYEHALPVLEWGINLVIALRFHHNLMLHAAVVERNGFCMLMPAMPGDGKTTLCSALVQRGWRLFSDEFGLVRPGSQQMIPLPRPPALKNASIDVIRQFAPEAHIGPSTAGTRKGTVAHLKPSKDSVERSGETAPVGLIVFPRWTEGADLNLAPMGKADALMNLGSNAFNFELQGEEGFDTVASLVQTSECYSLNYSRLEEAAGVLSKLADDRGG